MLGRLGMSVENAIACYGTLSGRVFSNVKHTWGDGRFRASELEKLVKAIVKEHTGQENARMIGTLLHDKGCKTWAIYCQPSC